MPKTFGVSQIAPVRPVPVPPLSINKVNSGIDVVNVSNRQVPTFTHCHIPDLYGKHWRSAIGHAVSASYDVMAMARTTASSSHAKALNRSMLWLGPASGEKFGSVVLSRFAALGELHAAVSIMMRETPSDQDLARCKKVLEKLIVDLAVTSGKCKSAPLADYEGSKTEKVMKSVAKAGKYMAECGAKLDRQRLFETVASVFLAKPMVEALGERLPNALGIVNGAMPSGFDMINAVAWEYAELIESKIERFMEVGTPEMVEAALMEVLKLPEFVLWRRSNAPAQSTSAQ